MITFLIIVLAAALILYAVIFNAGPANNKRRGRGPSLGHKPSGRLDLADIRARWELISATSKTGASGLKSSINEADKLLDHIMRQKGYPGTTMGERLRVACRDMSDRDGVWRAHKLRNALAHEVGFDLVPSQAHEALRDFERGMRDLGAL